MLEGRKLVTDRSLIPSITGLFMREAVHHSDTDILRAAIFLFLLLQLSPDILCTSTDKSINDGLVGSVDTMIIFVCLFVWNKRDFGYFLFQ